MTFYFSKHNRYFFSLMLKMLLLVFLGSTLGIFTQINRFVYDRLHSSMPVFQDAHQDFLLIDLSHIQASQYKQVFEDISSFHPTFVIADIFHQKNNLNEKMIIDILNTHQRVLFSMPEFSAQTSFDSLNLSHSTKRDLKKRLGLYRLKQIQEATAYKQIPSHEYAELIELLPTVKIVENFAYEHYINYNGLPPFAKVYANDILNKNVIPELFKDKIVLVSNFNNNYAKSPISALDDPDFLHQRNLSFMLKSAFENSWLYLPSTEIRYIILSITILILILLGHFYAYKYITIILFGSVLLPLALFYSSSAFLHFLLPVSEMIFISVITTLFLLIHWQKIKNLEEQSLLLNISKRLQEKVVHKTFFNSDKYWDDLTTLINQLFNLDKNILFEKLNKDTRIKEISSYNCSFEEIEEMRRDYTREPYATAIRLKKLSHPNRKFFHDIDAQAKEFIVPLIYHTEIVGFWAFVLKESEVEKMTNFDTIINDCAKEISELIFHRSVFIKQKKNKEHKLEHLLDMDLSDTTVNTLKSSHAIIEKRMLLTELIFDNLNLNAIVYDLFGRIIQINQGMSALLEKEEQSPYTLTASDMLHALTDLSIIEAKDMIRDVTFNQKKYLRFVTFKHSQKKYLLIISSITKDELTNKFSENCMFQTYGILFEFINLGVINSSYSMKENILQGFNKNKDNRLCNLEKAITLLSNQPVIGQKNSDIDTLFKQTIHDIIFMQNKLTMLLEQQLENNEDDLYPLNILPSINNAKDLINEKYRTKQLNILISQEENIPLVLASIQRIEAIFFDLIEFLAIDSGENSEITIDVTNEISSIKIIMKNRGYALPEEKFEEYFNSSEAPAAYKNIRQAQELIQGCWGELNFKSHLGEGYIIDMRLKSIDL